MSIDVRVQARIVPPNEFHFEEHLSAAEELEAQRTRQAQHVVDRVLPEASSTIAPGLNITLTF